MLQSIARAARLSDHRLIDDMPEPWEGYYPEIRDKVLATVVAHKPDHGTPGLKRHHLGGAAQRHRATVRSAGPDAKGVYTVVVRKPLADMKPKPTWKTVRDAGSQGQAHRAL